MEETKQRVRSFLSGFIRNYQLRDDEDIFATGHVNSLFVMQLVIFVEDELGCAIADEDLEMTNFSSVDAIAQTVSRKNGTVGVS